MSLNRALLPEFEHETTITRRLLERVPNDKLGWQPHAKSMTLGRLASHIAELPLWTAMTIQTDELDMNPPGGEPQKGANFGSREEMLSAFDRDVIAAREAISGASDEVLFGNWALKNAGETIFTMPKIACLRTWCFNHLIHHRGQLSVYLRLNDVSVPSIYGPSADEAM